MQMDRLPWLGNCPLEDPMQSTDPVNRRRFLATAGTLATCSVNQTLQQRLGAQEPLVKPSEVEGGPVAILTERIR